MMKNVMLVDQTKCINCSACTVVCKNRYDFLPFGVFRTTMEKHETGTFPDVKAKFLKRACMHCEEAGCLKICPVKAISKASGENGGMVLIDTETCIGCGACVGACPFDVPVMVENWNDTGKKISEKCTFCAQRVTKEKTTLCSDACPQHAIYFGNRDELIVQGGKRVDDLKAKGKDKARLYGVDEINVLYVLDDEPAAYGLPEEGVTLSALGMEALASALTGGGMLFAALGGLGLKFYKEKFVKNNDVE